MIVAPTTRRVRANTPAGWNERIRRRTSHAIAGLPAGDRAAIERRQRALDREWTVERITALEAPLTILTLLALGQRRRLLLVLPVALASFLLLDAVRGWYPLLPLLRWLGVRGQEEVEEERRALWALRDGQVPAPARGARSATVDA